MRGQPPPSASVRRKPHKDISQAAHRSRAFRQSAKAAPPSPAPVHLPGQVAEECYLLMKNDPANSNFDTYNSLTPNWYYKVLR